MRLAVDSRPAVALLACHRQATRFRSCSYPGHTHRDGVRADLNCVHPQQVFPNAPLTTPLQLFTIDHVAVPATSHVVQMRIALDRLMRSALLRSFAQQVVLCALVACFAICKAQAGFHTSLKDPPTTSASLTSESNDDPHPGVPKVTPVYPEDAHAGGAGTSSSGSGTSVSGQYALSGSPSGIIIPSIGAWMVVSMVLEFPPPRPLGVFHPPRGARHFIC